MSLDVRLLEKVRALANGLVQARCPACAERGGDRAGEHLRIYPDGRFGCCVHPKVGEHRKRIFALAGDKSRRPFRVKVAGRNPVAEPARSMAASLIAVLGTLGTANSESVSSGNKVSQASHGVESSETLTFGTLGTPILMSHAYGREDKGISHDDPHICKDIENAVPSVPNLPTAERLPFLTPGGDLSIPFDSPERFHWWKGGQSVADTRAEVELWAVTAEGKDDHGAHF